ncbi:MAG: cyanophycinase [Candidatus Acidiferrales bacterium]
MIRLMQAVAVVAAVMVATAFGAVAQDASAPSPTSRGIGYVEYTLAAKAPAQTHPPYFGVVMLGGHGDVDEATAFFCEHSGGGKVVILRASGDDDYNKEFHEKCPANSTTTIVFSSREASEQPWVLAQLRDAHAIFIAGGDQSNYIKFWKGTSVQKEMNAAIASGVPIAGISAGLAVEGEFIFASMIDTVTTERALANPYDIHVTLAQGFLAIPQLRGVITDSHYSARSRMGRSVVFAARILQDGWAKQIHVMGIDETTAVLVQADGSARVVGKGAAHIFAMNAPAETCVDGKPLTARNISGFVAPAGSSLNLRTWTATPAEPFTINVVNGKMTVTK